MTDVGTPRMQINMTTFAGRRPHYVVETLKSLFASDWQDTDIPINLMLGSEEDWHVREFASHPRVRLVPWDQQALENMRWNCTLNKIRALHYGDHPTTVICEDDILFHVDWCASLRAATAEMGEDDYILVLYTGRAQLDPAPLMSGKTWIKEYPLPILQGAQALYYPNRTLRCNVADYLRENMTEACGDELIGRYARGRAALYSTQKNLAWHIGAISCFPQPPLDIRPPQPATVPGLPDRPKTAITPADREPERSQDIDTGVIVETGRPLGSTDLTIELTSVPAFGSFLNLKGIASQADPESMGVAAYIRVHGGWWNKPSWDAPVTPIAADGSFTVDIVTGGQDELATEISVFLIPADYYPPGLRGEADLPAELSERALAQAQVTRLP